MPISLSVDASRRRLYARVTGELTLAEAMQFVRTAREPVDRRDWPLLFDAAGATTRETEAAVDVVVAFVKTTVAREVAPRGYVALVADDDRLYSIFLVYEARLADADVRIVRTFRRRADADRWLDIMTSARRFA
jgi:hypothetical protein